MVIGAGQPRHPPAGMCGRSWWRSYDTMTGVADVGNYQGQRLWNATIAAFAVLDGFGFRVCETHLDAWRGADVTVASETVTIAVVADWSDRELAVWVHVAGARPMPIQTLIPELHGLLRLPREATRGVLQRRLERIVQALQVRAPEVLTGGQPALARVLEADGEAT